jgi:hypothetical protein
MYILDLVIEVTRRCNMKCAHCLRGEPQNKTLKEEHLRNLLRQVSYISNVTFTGGEPTLPSGLKMINKFIDLCHAYEVEVGNWYIVTNGLKYRSNLPRTIWRLQNLCCDNEVSGIDISDDKFHESDSYDRSNFSWQLEEGLLEEGIGYDEVTVGKRGEIYSVIAEGRGKTNQIGDRNMVGESLIYDFYDNELQIREGTLYLNCNGNIILGCDWSYESQELQTEHILCKVEDSIFDAVKEKGELEEECQAA